MSNIAIKTEHLSKYYRLGIINNGVLFRDLQTWWALKRGKQDPHSRIGENKYDSSKEGFWALKDLDFEIQQGDRVGIIGKNGAGKSTLLKILSRITAPTEGEIKIKGRVASLLEVGTGFHGELTGRENIYLNGAILGMKRREVNQKLDEIIAFSEIEQHIDTPVKRYSSGMYVRLAFAVAAHLDSEILIADEVLAVGDATFQKKALGKMNDLSMGQGRTVLFVSHQMNAVKALCNKGMVLEGGQMVYEGEIEGAIDRYMYIGDKKKKNHLVWENDGTIENPYFTARRMRILEDDLSMVKYPTSNEKAYIIELVFDIEKLNNLLIYEFHFYVDGIKLFRTTPLQSISNYTPKIGENKIYLKIPKHLLNTKQYQITLEASLFNQEWILNPHDDIPSVTFFIDTKTDYLSYPLQDTSLCYNAVSWVMQ